MRTYLKTMRQNFKLSQHDVAKALGITQQYYALIENGDRQQDLNLSFMDGISKIFDVSLPMIIEAERQYLNEKEAS